MPTDCEPCPGNTKAIFTWKELLPAHQHRTPREPAANTLQHHVLSGFYAAIAYCEVEGQRD